MRWLRLLFFAIVFAAAATANRDQVFVGSDVYFVDADCYSRMTRVREVLKNPFRRIDHHDFENFPEGTNPHTTAPMDWTIAALATVLSPFSKNSLDIAGAWISPLLGLLTLIGLWAWSERMKIPYRGAMLVLFSISPMLAQGFKLGRPDHQSLVLMLVAFGVCAEWSLWRSPSRKSAILWGVSWGLALWTSLYEPLVLFAVLLLVRLPILKRRAFTKDWAIAAGVLLAILAVALVFDGWRLGGQSPVIAEYFPLWAKSIAELTPVPPFSPQYFAWVGWLAPLLPILLGWQVFRKKLEPAIIPMVLAVLTYGLTCWQLRWGACFALFAAMAMPFALAAIKIPAAAWTAFVISLVPIATQWDTALFPDASRRAALDESKVDYQLLRQVSHALVSDDETPILAPWWLCPPLAYWSGQPCVAGSSHESLPGTVDTAEFYMSTETAAARQILMDHRVRYVVAYEPSRVLSTSALLLDRSPLPGTIAETLYSAPRRAPEFLRPVFANQYFRVYEFETGPNQR